MFHTQVKIFILFLFGYMMYMGSPASVRSQEINNPVNNQEESEPVSDKVELPPSPDGFCGLTSVDCSNTVSNQTVVRPVDSDKIKILKEVCEKRGMPSGCWKTLWGIVMTESRGDCSVVGDKNLKDHAYGCFQIRAGLHGISIEDAVDFKKSAEWTISNMQKHGYPVYRSVAIRRHQGWGDSTLAYLETVNKYSLSVK